MSDPELMQRRSEMKTTIRMRCMTCQRRETVKMPSVLKWGYRRFEFPEGVAMTGSDRIDDYANPKRRCQIWCRSCTTRHKF